MKRPWVAVLIALAAGSLAFGGNTPWKDESYTQWNKGDVTRILQDSPWAKALSVGGTLKLQGNNNLDGSGLALGEGGAGQGGPLSGPGGASSVMPAEHDQPLNDPRAPKTYVVVWWSARTVREAAAQNAVLSGTETAESAKKQVANSPADYQIMIHGPDMSLFDQRPEQSFLDKGYLQLKSSKEKIQPTRVQYMRTAEGHVSAAIFHFPAKEASGAVAISASEKRIDFYCQVGEGIIRTWFEPGKMVDNQGVDL